MPPKTTAVAGKPKLSTKRIRKSRTEYLDKVRGAPDFGDAALPLLVHALQQGEACFSQAEKARVMSAAARD
ncbi:putative sds23 moc1 protein [Lasiodiplodia theobromae]|nr:putative sds23 moc1 protein [Lasiodiplodia theobromae]